MAFYYSWSKQSLIKGRNQLNTVIASSANQKIKEYTIKPTSKRNSLPQLEKPFLTEMPT